MLPISINFLNQSRNLWQKYSIDFYNIAIVIWRHIATQTEYLCTVIEAAVSHDLPNELNFLQNYDEAKGLMKQRVDMPDKLMIYLSGLLTRIAEFSQRGEEILSKC